MYNFGADTTFVLPAPSQVHKTFLRKVKFNPLIFMSKSPLWLILKKTIVNNVITFAITVLIALFLVGAAMICSEIISPINNYFEIPEIAEVEKIEYNDSGYIEGVWIKNRGFYQAYGGTRRKWDISSGTTIAAYLSDNLKVFTGLHKAPLKVKIASIDKKSRKGYIHGIGTFDLPRKYQKDCQDGDVFLMVKLNSQFTSNLYLKRCLCYTSIYINNNLAYYLKIASIVFSKHIT